MSLGKCGSPQTFRKNTFYRLSACTAHVIRHKNVSFLDRIVTCDEKKPHAATMTDMKLNELGYETLQHTPYSPNLSPTDFHFFKHLDHFILRKTFSITLDITNSINEFLDSKNPDFFKNGIFSLVDRWQKCIEAAGLITFCFSSNTMS